MAKDNNLKDFIADIADAIREKKGTTEKINPQDFSDEIRWIESGGDGFNAKAILNKEDGFGIKYITELTINDGVTTLGDGACEGMKNLKKINIPNSVTIISDRLFYGCLYLEDAVINNIQQLTNYMYYNCNSLKNFKIPATATSIPDYCFSNCRSISSFVLPSGIVRIGTAAFNGCRASLFDFRAVLQVPTLSNTNAYDNMPVNYKIVVPDALYDDWIVATNWTTYASRIVKASEFVEENNE